MIKKRLPEYIQDSDDTDFDDHEPGRADTIGSRIRSARLKMRLSQTAVGKYVGVGRTTVTQWENDRSSPDIQTVSQIANLTNTEASWIAYGVSTGPTVVDPDPEKLGYALVDQISFGESPTDMFSKAKFGMATNWLREIGATNPKQVMLYKVDTAFKDTRYQIGDLLIVDRASTRPSPPGTFLYWDGVGPSLADMAVVPKAGGKKIVVQITPLDGKSFEVEVDQVPIIGRIRGHWGQS